MPSTKNINAVKSLSDKLGKAKAVYFTDYLGLDVVSITQLRKEFVMKDVEFTIAKNTLIKLAAKEAGMSRPITSEWNTRAKQIGTFHSV